MNDERLLPDSIPSSLADCWREWQLRVFDLLSLDPKQSLAMQTLEKPWFLIPTQAELNETEAQALMDCVRDYLCFDGYEASSIRKRMSALGPEASLPFLYTMRYVAFKEGGRDEYWPGFRRMLFGDRLSYNEVALGLASTTSNLWLQLYQVSNGALYYPREGSRHIKWPLAHAGLSADDKNTLEDFGVTILGAGAEQFSAVTAAESDEFLLFFADWLRNNPSYTNSRLARLFKARGTEKHIIAELAQQWLQAHRDRLDTTQGKAAETGPLIHRHIVFDSRENQLGVLFDIAPIKGRSTIELVWNDSLREFQTQYDPSTNETIPLQMFVPVEGQGWSAHAQLNINGSVHVFDVPSFERGENLVFDRDTGALTKRWELGREYYVLLRGKVLESHDLNRVFRDWLVLEPLRGKWDDYAFLWVKTRDPFSASEIDEENVTQVLVALEQSVGEMGLPSFGHQYRIRLSLVGGQWSFGGDPAMPTFSTHHPPFAEVRGIWNSDVQLRLRRLDDVSGQFLPLTELTIPAELSGTSCIVELLPTEPIPGQYQVILGRNVSAFVIGREALDRTEDIAFEAEVAADFLSTEGEVIFGPSRHRLNELKLKVTAWPRAELTLSVSGENVLGDSAILLQTDGQGELVQDLADVPIDFRALPSGPISLRIGWRGIFTTELIAPDTDYISVNVTELAVTQASEGYVFTCRGGISSTIENLEGLVGLLLPLIPWQRQPQVFPLSTKKGMFESNTTLKWSPGWFVVASQKTSGDMELVSVHQVATDRSAPTIGDKSTNVRWGKTYDPGWPDLAGKIAQISHPPSLSAYLAIEPSLSFIAQTAKRLQAPEWILCSRWEELQEILDHVVLAYPAALFRRGKYKSQNKARGHCIEIDSLESAHNLDAFPFHFSGDPGIGGVLIPKEYLGESRIGVRPTANLYGCSVCGIIVPANSYYDHSCTHIKRAFLVYPADKLGSESVIVAVWHDPMALLRTAHHHLQRVLQGEKDIPAQFLPMFSQIRKLVPSDVDPRRWLEGFIMVLDHFLSTIESSSVSLKTLVNRARLMRDYVSALEVFVNAIDIPMG